MCVAGGWDWEDSLSQVHAIHDDESGKLCRSEAEACRSKCCCLLCACNCLSWCQIMFITVNIQQRGKRGHLSDTFLFFGVISQPSFFFCLKVIFHPGQTTGLHALHRPSSRTALETPSLGHHWSEGWSCQTLIQLLTWPPFTAVIEANFFWKFLYCSINVKHVFHFLCTILYVTSPARSGREPWLQTDFGEILAVKVLLVPAVITTLV